MNTLNPYLTFNGNCLEAMEFYKSCLGGKLDVSTFGEAPGEMTDEEKDLIMHARLESEGIIIMASDTNTKNGDVNFGSNISLNINTNDVATAEKLYAALANGGKETMPLQETFWGATFGMLTDKFGLHWMINCQL